MQRKRDFDRNFNRAIIFAGVFLIFWLLFSNLQAAKMAKTVANNQPAVSQDAPPTKLMDDLASSNILDMADATSSNPSNSSSEETTLVSEVSISRAEALKDQSHRLPFANDDISGSINLKGLVLDDLIFRHHFRTTSDQTPVALLSPAASDEANYLRFAFFSNDSSITMPDSNTLWQANSQSLQAGQEVILSYTNPQGFVFKVTLSLDDQYLFHIKQSVYNPTSKNVAISFYGKLTRDTKADNPDTRSNLSLHGLIGVFNDKLETMPFTKISKAGSRQFSGQQGWFGFSEGYWLTAIVPEADCKYKIEVSGNDQQNFALNFVCNPKLLTADTEVSSTYQLFTGTKKVELLNHYVEANNIKLLDRALDLGRLYFISKPMLLLLDFLYRTLGSFSISIIVLTILVRLLLYPLNKKSMVSMEKMKLVKPELDRINQTYGPKSPEGQQAIIALYQKMEINPFASLLPLLLQIPIFFALYRVFSVSIDMRHASFLGWIKDLSAADPTSILNLFGLLPYTAPRFLHIGILPILMGLTMYLQTRLASNATTAAPNTANSNTTADPQTAMKWMPLIFVFLFAQFPAGLMIYWICTNLLSIAQQWYIGKYVVQNNAAIPFKSGK